MSLPDNLTAGETCDVGQQARRLADALGEPVRPHSLGGESATFRIDGTDHLVRVPRGWPTETEPPDEVARRITLQQRIAQRVTVPVPPLVTALPTIGLVVVRRLEGIPLLEVAHSRRAAMSQTVATALGTLLAELHTWAPDEYDDVAVIDDYSPADWRDEVADLFKDLRPILDETQRRDVQRFLAQQPPTPASRLVLSHNDLGIEHVLISDTTRPPAVAGVIDWDDAAICDPAYDFGLLLRDLGPVALSKALASYAASGATTVDIAVRAEYYARCKLLEDLTFGLSHDRPTYSEKSLAAWARTFGHPVG